MQLSPVPAAQPEIARVERFTVSFPDRLDTYQAPASAAGVRDQLASIASEHQVAMSPVEEVFLESMPMQFQLRGSFTGESAAVGQAIAAVKAIKPGETTGGGTAPTTPTTPAADAASSAFSLLYSQYGPSSASNAGERVQFTADQYGVTLSDLRVGPAVLESLPPQGHVTGTVSGPADAVTHALGALELLEHEI